MLIETTDKAYASQKGTRGRQLLPLFVALVFALMIYPTKARAQIVGDLDASTSHFSSTPGTSNFRQASTASTCWMTPI